MDQRPPPPSTRRLDEDALHAWTRVAIDAEAFERSLGEADAGEVAVPPALSRRQKLWPMAKLIGFALAACVTLAVVWMLVGPAKSGVSTVTPPLAEKTPNGSMEGFEAPLPRVVPSGVPPTSDDHAFVLAVYAPSESADGSGDSCDEWRISSVDTGCPLQQLDSADLLKAAMSVAGKNAPTGLHVIAVSGPMGVAAGSGITSAGVTRSIQDKVTACLRASQGCQDDSNCVMASAADCLPAGLTIVSKSLSTAR